MNAISHANPVVGCAPVPDIPATAPTFAKLLHSLMSALERADDVPPSGEEKFAAALGNLWNVACAALAAIPTVDSPTRVIGGDTYWRAEDGSLVPASIVKETDKLKDEYTRGVAAAALQLSASLARFKSLSMAEGQALVQLLAAEHRIELGGVKGNVVIHTFDREWQVDLAKADRVSFGPEIQAARAALEQWVRETQGAPELKVVINRAFGLDQAGALRPAELFRLMSYEMPGDTWATAMDALRASIQVTGKAEYLRVRHRLPDGRYELIPLDLASV